MTVPFPIGLPIGFPIGVTNAVLKVMPCTAQL